jgi:hypothetical protein
MSLLTAVLTPGFPSPSYGLGMGSGWARDGDERARTRLERWRLSWLGHRLRLRRDRHRALRRSGARRGRRRRGSHAGEHAGQVTDDGVQSWVRGWLADGAEICTGGAGCPASAGHTQNGCQRHRRGQNAAGKHAGGTSILRPAAHATRFATSQRRYVFWTTARARSGYCFGGILSVIPSLSLSGSAPMVSLLAS